jgi:hypothetical protein
MRATFVTCFHTNRMSNLLQTLRFLSYNHSEVIKDCELITLCQNSIEFEKTAVLNEFERLTNHFKKCEHFDLEIEEMELSGMTNRGVCASRCDKIIVLESDRILPSGYFEATINQIQSKVSITCKNMKKLKSEASDEDIKDNNFEYNDEHRTDTNEIGLRNMWSGNTAFWKKDFFDAEKMDEGYVGYGWADSDMTNKMNEVGVKNIFRDEIELHLWHPSQTYGKMNPKKLFIQNGIRFCKKWNVEYSEWFKQEIEQFYKISP